MMYVTFEHAWNLWLLVLVPLTIGLHFYFLRHVQRKGLKFANFRALKRITGKRLITRNYSMIILRSIVVLLFVLAASGLVVWYEGAANESDFVIAIDASASMMTQDIAPNRLGAAKNDAVALIDVLQGETRIGVLSFAAISYINTPPTTDRELARSAVREIEVMETSGTDIPGAIITSINMMQDLSKGRSIIMITDGTTTVDTFIDDSLTRAIAYAQLNKVSIHVVGVGTNAGPVGFLPTYYNISAQYDEETLRLLTNATDGIYVKADTSSELLDAFQTVTNSTTRQLLKRELAPLLLTIGLLLLILEWLLVNTRFRALP